MTDRNGRVDFNNSGIVQLFRDVCGYITAHWPASDQPALVFGMRERWKQINDDDGGANRICMVPGTLTGEDGVVDGPLGPGDSEGHSFSGVAHPRTIVVQSKIVTFSLWASDHTTPDVVNDEVAQQEAIETMQEWLYRAVKASSVGGANATWKAHKYNRNPTELRYGTEYLMTLELETPFLDRDNVPVIPAAAIVSRNPAT